MLSVITVTSRDKIVTSFTYSIQHNEMLIVEKNRLGGRRRSINLHLNILNTF